MGDFPQIQTRVDIKKLHAQTSSAPFRRHSFSDSLLRSRNMDTEQRTRKNESIDATQGATTHHPDKKEIQKNEKQDIEPKEENGIVDITENCSTDDESDDGQSTKSKDDVDSEVTLEEDSDEEMDTIEIEEEDWIEYIKRSTVDALDQDGTCKDSLLEQDTQKMKLKLALRIATSRSERWLKKAAEWNPDLSSRYRTNRAIGRPRKRWEDDINEFLKQEFEENENPIERSNETNKTWINFAKDRRRWALLEEDYTWTV